MLLILALLISCSAAQAGILWSWANGGTGTEQGTFITEGELVDGLAPAGVYTIVDASVTASANTLQIGSISGGIYFTNMPEIGFDWDGADVTVFWRDSGNWTNGFGLNATTPIPGEADYLVFGIDYFSVESGDEMVLFQENVTAIIIPEDTITPVEVTTFVAVKILYR